MKSDETYKKLSQLVGKSGGKFSILEEQVDVNLQMIFFEFVNDLQKTKRDDEVILSESGKLMNTEMPDDEKKVLLAELSICESVQAYRVLENYLKNASQELKSWALLSFQYCRIGLESKLMDEHQVFISTGLGGKDSKLRYFIAGKHNAGLFFTDSQRKIIQTESECGFKKNNSVIEKIEFFNQYYILISLIPIEVDINKLIDDIIAESNQFGNFLSTRFLITNVKLLSIEEVEKYFSEKK